MEIEESKKYLKGMLELFHEAPDSQIDKSIVERIKVLDIYNSDFVKDMTSILDDCANYALASSFAMVSLNHVLEEAIVIYGE